MVVDDSIVSHAMMERILDRTDYEICGGAKNCAEAVEMYETLRPDVVTMDMNLPDADGLECSRRILKCDPGAKIVMISAMKDVRLMMRGRAVGISSFLQKPLEKDELLNTLRMVHRTKGDFIGRLQESYVKPFVGALQKNLFSLAGLHSEIKVEADAEKELIVNGVGVIIGLTGSPAGRAIFHMDAETMHWFSRSMLGMHQDAPLADGEALDSVEEAANIIMGGGVSMINDAFKDQEMRITPPGTVCGKNIRIVNPKLTSFHIIAETKHGEFKINIGFAGGEV